MLGNVNWNVNCVKYYQFFNGTMIHQGSFTTQGWFGVLCDVSEWSSDGAQVSKWF